MVAESAPDPAPGAAAAPAKIARAEAHPRFPVLRSLRPSRRLLSSSGYGGMASKRSEYLDEEAWIEGALDLLVSGSIDTVGVEPLAHKLGVTKGSFYWHFTDRAALLKAILRRWQERATMSVIDRLEHGENSARERLRKLGELPHSSKRSRRGALVELAIRDWARKDPMAAAAALEVDRQRLKYLASLYREMGLDPDEARARAYQMYAFQLAEALIDTADSDAARISLRNACVEFMLRPADEAAEP